MDKINTSIKGVVNDTRSLHYNRDVHQFNYYKVSLPKNTPIKGVVNLMYF